MTNKFEDFIAPFCGKSNEWARGAATAWQHRQNEVDQLNDRLNAMEQCYIAMKKERDDALYLKNEHRKRRVELSKVCIDLHSRLNQVVHDSMELLGEDTSTPQVIIDAERRGAPCL
ncbi:hypothetical protein [Acinetobacter sp. CFCC 11171]|uniref:hypothetical protein n=1 Tax=Acinetobacter sp. CFCC 11171 TaxID=1775558 RepID=UPI000DCF764A|nr:hypothetical protein [Acinetobacter sp. CFCC 11171]